MNDNKYRTFARAVLSPNFSHCSRREWCRVMIVYAYHRRSDSPSGVILEASLGLETDADQQFVKCLAVMPGYEGPQRGDLALTA